MRSQNRRSVGYRLTSGVIIMYNTYMIKHNVTLSDEIAQLVDELIAEYKAKYGVKLSRPQAIAYASRQVLAQLKKAK